MHVRSQGATTALGHEAAPAVHTMIDPVAPKAAIPVKAAKLRHFGPEVHTPKSRVIRQLVTVISSCTGCVQNPKQVNLD
jgi:hypothetical protein